MDIWQANLASRPGELCRIAQCLDDAEQQRAARFRFQRDRDRFLASRGLLRLILARYLDSPPERIRFGYAREGKPFLLEHPDVHFNLSHADDVLVVGVARGRVLGVDVERMFSEAVMEEVSAAVLSKPERGLLEGLKGGERREWFVRLWTRKEAYLKADGRGMSLRLDGIDASTCPNRVRLIGNAPDDWRVSQRWVVQELAVGSGYAAAIVAEGLDWQVAYLDWPSDAQ